jgi:hypothetical protein
VGINTPVRLYELLNLRSKPEIRDETESRQAEYLAAWEKAIGLFEKGFFAQAGEIFSALINKMPQDNTAKLYAEWCLNYIDMPPLDWDGINNLMEK